MHLRFRIGWLAGWPACFYFLFFIFYLLSKLSLSNSAEIKEVLELGEATIEFMPHGDQATKPELLERFTVGEPPKEEGEEEEEVEQSESA